jgi:hypothetical protein
VIAVEVPPLIDQVTFDAVQDTLEVADREVRIMRPTSNLLKTLAAISGVKSAADGVRSSVLDWRRGRDSNPR